MTNNCLYCKGPLVPMGNARKNGKSHNDWEKRELHKKCFVQGIKTLQGIYKMNCDCDKQELTEYIHKTKFFKEDIIVWNKLLKYI